MLTLPEFILGAFIAFVGSVFLYAAWRARKMDDMLVLLALVPAVGIFSGLAIALCVRLGYA